MIRWFLNLWNSRRRRVDMEILWPICKQKAPDLDHAKAAFAVHALHDESWLCLGQDEVIRIIDRLE